MTLQEAIGLLSDIPYIFSKKYHRPSNLAIYLGIEALKAILEAREGNYAAFKLPLPSETPQDEPLDSFTHDLLTKGL